MMKIDANIYLPSQQSSVSFIYRYWLWALPCFVSFSLCAQVERTQNIDLEKFAEAIFALQDSDVNYEDLYESLFLLYTDPIHLNHTSKEELRTLYLLSENQLNHFFEYRSQYGRLLSIYELQAIPSFDLGTIRAMLPFVTVSETGLSEDNRRLWQRIGQEENSYLILRYDRTLEDKRGYRPEDTPTPYLGSPDKLYTRLRIGHTRDFSLGFTLEKDAGEPIKWAPSTQRYGPDFISFHFHLQNKGRLKYLALGDYQLQFGQGLLMSAGFNVGKGATTVATARRSNLGILPYTSVVESGFMRGAAMTYALDSKVDITAFYSGLPQDARVQNGDSTTSGEALLTSAISDDGFHRTSSELDKKWRLHQQAMGANITYHNPKKTLTLGMNYLHDRFSLPVPESNEVYRLFEFNGRFNHAWSIFADYNWQNFNFFGEAGRSSSRGAGIISGFVSSLSNRLDMALSLRRYERHFHNLWGGAFAENRRRGAGARNINESGAYWGLLYRPSRRWALSGYIDRFRHDWLRFRANAPTKGMESLLRATYTPSKNMLVFLQYREETKETNSSTISQRITFPTPVTRRNIIINMDYPATEQLNFKTRIQFSNFIQEGNRTYGYAALQDIKLTIKQLRIITRFAIFETDDFNNRQYVYENDVLYAFSIPAYNGIGARSYVVIRYNATRKIDFWLKWARTRYIDRMSIGSGLEQINGNKKSDLRLQTRIRF